MPDLLLCLRRILGVLERSVALPSMGSCYRCHRPWEIVNNNDRRWGVEPHSTPYLSVEDGDDCSRSCFPLCQWCWSHLAVEKRIPYYRELYALWEENERKYGFSTGTTWEQIKEAVINEQERIH